MSCACLPAARALAARSCGSDRPNSDRLPTRRNARRLMPWQLAKVDGGRTSGVSVAGGETTNLTNRTNDSSNLFLPIRRIRLIRGLPPSVFVSFVYFVVT